MVACLLAWASLLKVAFAFCPPGCTCNDSAPSARCVGVGVSTVPILFNPGLRHLNMAHNSISSLEEGLIFLNQLRDVDFSHNLLTSVGVGNFKVQTELLELRLAHNNLTLLSSGAFKGLSALTLLDVSHNNLADLPAGVLDDVPRLTFLHLAHNRLHILTQHPFRDLKNLLTLDLCDNYFRHVPTEALEDLWTLQTLLLCRNRLTRIDSVAFPTESLTFLSLETNNIEYIHETAFLRLRQLHKLNLDYNVLRAVPTDSLASLITLDSLYLSRNRITNIGSGAFKGLKQLLILEMSRNPQLRNLHVEAFNECRKLNILIISHSPLLRDLPRGLFEPLRSLHNLDLRANGLQSLPESDVSWNSLRSLDLRGNPLVCNCSLRWLAALLSDQNASISAPDLQCAAPEKFRGVYLSRLVPTELCGERVQVMVVGVVVLSLFTVMLLTLSWLLCRYWQQQQRAKFCSEWQCGTLAPWRHSISGRHGRAEDYVYHTTTSLTKASATHV